ncbi:MAG TPA: recombinase family protein [Bryobacteraceae bacterium]|jgi:hypothetical protein|nr:recombinase family protein [Bryobacteraceae bacterium]
MLGVFAEFEAAIIRARVHAGLARAKAQGVKLGRPKVKPAVEQLIRELRAKGMGMIRIGKQLCSASLLRQKRVAGPKTFFGDGGLRFGAQFHSRPYSNPDVGDCPCAAMDC